MELCDVSQATPFFWLDVAFDVACDVGNPLCGERGASAIFGRKGATPDMNSRQLDKGR